MRQWVSAHCVCLKIYVTGTISLWNSSQLLILPFFKEFFDVYVLCYMHMYATKCIKVKGQLTRVASLLPCGLQVQTHLAVLAASTFTH